MVATAQEIYNVTYGVAALRFAAGSLRQSMPQDGIVNRITGDNQTTGNRMVLGWKNSDILYLKLHHPGEAVVGDLYTIYRKARKVFHPRTRQYIGYIVNMSAVVRIMQVDTGLATVKIVQSFAPISPGDPVMRYTPAPADEPDKDTSTSQATEGMIVDLQADKNMSLVGQGNIVYLDQGREEGIHPGDHLEIDRLGSGLPRRKIADMTVLSAESHTATGLIIKSTSRVLIGDRVRITTSDASRSFSSNDRPWLETHGTGTTPLPTDRSTRKVSVVEAEGGTRINLEDLAEQLEYDSGEVRIKPAGFPILERIAELLKTTDSDKLIRIEGHADNMEIGPSLKLMFASNWELSRARADGILRYLVEKGGLDPAKFSAVGYGASRPVASNSTEEGRKHNRRVEIVLHAPEPPHAVRGPNQRSGDIIVHPAKEPLGTPSASMQTDRVTGMESPSRDVSAVPTNDTINDQTLQSEPAIHQALPPAEIGSDLSATSGQ
jgi:chemotaxis protein MotB